MATIIWCLICGAENQHECHCPTVDLAQADESDSDYIECPACGGYSTAQWTESKCDHCGQHLSLDEID